MARKAQRSECDCRIDGLLHDFYLIRTSRIVSRIRLVSSHGFIIIYTRFRFNLPSNICVSHFDVSSRRRRKMCIVNVHTNHHVPRKRRVFIFSFRFSANACHPKALFISFFGNFFCYCWKCSNFSPQITIHLFCAHLFKSEHIWKEEEVENGRKE